MKNKKINLLSIFILFIAVIFIYVGFNNNEATVVMKKATKICLECIGIG